MNRPLTKDLFWSIGQAKGYSCGYYLSFQTLKSDLEKERLLKEWMPGTDNFARLMEVAAPIKDYASLRDKYAPEYRTMIQEMREVYKKVAIQQLYYQEATGINNQYKPYARPLQGQHTSFMLIDLSAIIGVVKNRRNLFSDKSTRTEYFSRLTLMRRLNICRKFFETIERKLYCSLQ